MTWKPKYPVTNMPHDLWEKFPEWFFDEHDPNALKLAVDTLDKINQWRNGIMSDLIALYDYLEKERKESNGEVSVKACYVYQQQLIKLFLGCSVKTGRQFLEEMGIAFNEPKTKKEVKIDAYMP